MNLILIGMRGTGKTGIGRCLAETLQRPFFDTDQLVEQAIGEAIPHYVGRLGWDPFREVEHLVISRMAEQRQAVISTGGGALTYARNIEVLKPTGVVILLAADPLTLARRLERSYVRPPLTQEPNLGAEMCALWRQREPIYRGVCDVVLCVDAQTDDAQADFHAKASALLALVHPFLDRESAH